MAYSCRYPFVIVEPAGLDDSTVGVVKRVCLALKLAGAPPQDIEQFRSDAMRGKTYGDTLATCTRWVAFE